MLWTIISFIIIFTFLVVSHEFGHFLVGRMNGIKVNEFMIGVGPAIFKKKTKSGMLFSIRILPFGGACVFDGYIEDDAEDGENTEEADDGKEDDNKEQIVVKEKSKAREGTFNACPVWGRIATLIAGPFFNVILAFILSIFLCWFCGTDEPILASVTEGMAAEQAGLCAGDKITAINNISIKVWREISLVSVLNDGSPINIEYERNGEHYSVDITPTYSEEDDRYYIGFSGGQYTDCSNITVFKYACYEVRYWFVATFRSLGYMVSGRGSLDDMSGPVGVANIIDDTIEETKEYGLFTVILNMMNITVLLSVNLGVLNLLPIPALDGGRLLMCLFEVIFRKPVPPEKEGLFHMVGFVLLAILMIVVLFNDVLRLFGM